MVTVFLEINPEQQEVLDRAAQSGMSQQEVLDQAFAVIREQLHTSDWLASESRAISVQIAEGFAQAERGELLEPEQAMQILRERRAKRQIV